MADNTQALWLPFTANKAFKKTPRIITAAQGHYYCSDDGRQLYDGFSGLWTSGLGHCHPKIVEAVQQQVAKLDYSMSFQMSNNVAIELADKLVGLAPEGIDHCFFTCSGSEAVETALKIALGYHKVKGDASRTRLVGRERGYHGVNFGGISVGGIGANRSLVSANLIPGVDHLPHTHNLEHNAFSKGQPTWGVHLADELENIIALNGSANIAAVIVEPVPGSTGVLPPPIGYLQQLRAICDKYGILLIFDEVINAFGRLGYAFSSERFGVVPDIITTAKGVTNGVIPMGAVLVRKEIYQAFMQASSEQAVEFFHGYTYSGHPVAAAAGLATLNVYQEEGSFAQARELEPHFQQAIHSLADHPKVIDVRNIGLMGAVELESRLDSLGTRGFDTYLKCFNDHDLVIRNGMDILQFAPFLNARPQDIEMMFEKVRLVLDELD